MNKAKKKRAKRKKILDAAYARVNSKPKRKMVKLRTPLGKMRVTDRDAVGMKAILREIKFRNRREEKEKSKSTTEVDNTDK